MRFLRCDEEGIEYEELNIPISCYLKTIEEKSETRKKEAARKFHKRHYPYYGI